LSKNEVKRVLYFETPGSHNTDHVVEAVEERVAESDVKHVIVASISGRTALKVAEKLEDSGVSVVCVSGCSSWLAMSGVQYPFVRGKVREKLEKLNVTIIDKMPSSLSDTLDYGIARYGYVPTSLVVAETLEAVGGYGLKTAVEAILMATDCAVVPPSVNVISVAGTDRGADTAIMAKSAYSPWMFSSDSAERFQIFEIIAMSRKKKWYKQISVGGLRFTEIEKGETLSEGTSQPHPS
jgi:hypothetical protein